MKALMFDTFMSAGSILDIGSNTKQGLTQAQRRLRRQQQKILIVCESPTDAMNLRNDWVTIGQDMQKSFDRFAVENNLITSSKCEGKACAEHSR